MTEVACTKGFGVGRKLPHWRRNSLANPEGDEDGNEQHRAAQLQIPEEVRPRRRQRRFVRDAHIHKPRDAAGRRVPVQTRGGVDGRAFGQALGLRQGGDDRRLRGHVLANPRIGFGGTCDDEAPRVYNRDYRIPRQAALTIEKTLQVLELRGRRHRAQDDVAAHHRPRKRRHELASAPGYDWRFNRKLTGRNRFLEILPVAHTDARKRLQRADIGAAQIPDRDVVDVGRQIGTHFAEQGVVLRRVFRPDRGNMRKRRQEVIDVSDIVIEPRRDDPRDSETAFLRKLAARSRLVDGRQNDVGKERQAEREHEQQQTRPDAEPRDMLAQTDWKPGHLVLRFYRSLNLLATRWSRAGI